MRLGIGTLLLAVLVALALAGCGSGGSSTSGSQTTSAAGAAAAKHAAAVAREAESEAPKGASSTLRAIYRQFQPPKADPRVTGSAEAIRAGIRACAATTPARVVERFIAAARAHLTPKQAKTIAGIESYEKNTSKDAAFTAGQLAADTYEATLPGAVGQYGYEGCIYSLARELEKRLAPKG
jgi:hypothetical protein